MRAYELYEGRVAPLYHGTGLGSLLNILETNALRASQDYDNDPVAVSLTRDPRVAFGFISRNGGDDLGAVLVLDQNKLMQRYRVRPFAAIDTDGKRIDNEEEEVVLGDITPLDRYLLSINIEERVFKALEEDFRFHRWFDDVGRDFSQIDDEEECRKRILELRHHPLLNRLSPRGSPSPRPYAPFNAQELTGVDVLKKHKDGIDYPTNMYGVMDDREMGTIMQRLARRGVVETELIKGQDGYWSNLRVTRGPNWYLTNEV